MTTLNPFRWNQQRRDRETARREAVDRGEIREIQRLDYLLDQRPFKTEGHAWYCDCGSCMQDGGHSQSQRLGSRFGDGSGPVR